jgi:predicted nicotinamide N-methyase
MYKTSGFQIQIGSYFIDIERITNIDELFDNLLAKGDNHEDVQDERIPYWAELWPSALALSHYMVELNYDWQGKNVLEIGCGLGLPGIVAGKLGAMVTLSDYLPEAIDFAKANWQRNNDTMAQFLTLDWRKPNINLAADVLIAADIAYEKRMFEFLIPAFQTLCKPDGVILLSEPNRAFAQSFLEGIEKEGFIVKKVQKKQSLLGMEYNINILEIRKK